MNVFLRAIERIVGRRSQRPKMRAASKRPINKSDAGFITTTMTASKWADVEYYGPGAAEAEARRRRSLGLDAEAEGGRSVVVIDHDIKPD